MIVIDASATIEWLLQTPRGARVRQRILTDSETLHAPFLLDVELMQALRKASLIHGLSPSRGEEALQDFFDMRIHRYAHTPFLQRVWALRHNLSAYDAIYIALAEEIGATLVTCDSRLANAPGHRAWVEVV